MSTSSLPQRIRNRLCGPKRSRPGRREKKRCNTFRSGLQNLARAPLNPQFLNSCDMKWVAGDWEPCTTSCGKDGTRQREVKSNETSSKDILKVYCLPRDAPKTDQLWLNMRDTRHCGHLIKPPAEEECARLPCPSFWQETGWSNCTAVDSQKDSGLCQGSRHLSYRCPASRQHLCGPRPPPHVAYCQAQVVSTYPTFCQFIFLKFKMSPCLGKMCYLKNPNCQGCPEPICSGDQSALCSDQVPTYSFLHLP